MQTLLIEITPSVAKRMLSLNKDNRILNYHEVEKYARDMRAGNWRVTHQGMLIGKNDMVIDGQHRLHAIVRSGVTLNMLVSWDDSVESAIDLPIDVGYKRGNSFILGIDTHHAAIARLAVQYCKGVTNVSASDVKPFSDIAAPAYSLLVSVGKTARAKVTTAPLQLAGITKILLGEDVEYVVSTYNAMANLKFENIAPLPCSFLKQLTIVERKGFSAKEIFSRSMKAFSYQGRDRSRMLFQNEELAFTEALVSLRKAFRT